MRVTEAEAVVNLKQKKGHNTMSDFREMFLAATQKQSKAIICATCHGNHYVRLGVDGTTVPCHCISTTFKKKKEGRE